MRLVVAVLSQGWVRGTCDASTLLAQKAELIADYGKQTKVCCVISA
jgi:hypothetical protein